MGLNASNVQGPQRERKALPPIEPDVYGGYLVQIIDMGLQPQKPYLGKEKPPANEIAFTYELATEFMQDDEGVDMKDKPRWISETLPFYGLFADKAKSTLRYHAFDPTGQFNGDFAKCIALPMNITVVNNTVGDITYNNIGHVAPMAAKKAAGLPKLVNPTKVFDLDAPNMEVFKALPEWIQKKISSNLNYQGSPLQKALGGKPQEKDPEKEPEVEAPSNNPY